MGNPVTTLFSIARQVYNVAREPLADCSAHSHDSNRCRLLGIYCALAAGNIEQPGFWSNCGGLRLPGHSSMHRPAVSPPFRSLASCFPRCFEEAWTLVCFVCELEIPCSAARGLDRGTYTCTGTAHKHTSNTHYWSRAGPGTSRSTTAKQNYIGLNYGVWQRVHLCAMLTEVK